MKKLIIIALALTFVLAMGSLAKADPVCAKILDGTIITRGDGATVEIGYDDFGYNYGAKRYSGRYCDADRVLGGSSCDIDLSIKWNDNHLSTEDCDGDGFLDRPTDYMGSGSWVTNHMTGTTLDSNGKLRKWHYFVKMVAVPSDAILAPCESSMCWFTADGDPSFATLIGPTIGDKHAIIQEIYNDPVTGDNGILYKTPLGPGLGTFQ